MQFVAGFIAAILVIFPIALLLVRKVAAKNNSGHEGASKELEELSKLTGGLAHEIKNPLSTVKVNLKLISEDFETGAQNLARSIRKIEVVRKETERVEQILDDFLKYVGKSELQLCSADINELISDIVDFYSPQAQSHSITVRLGLAEEALICKLDPDVLKQVLLNIFINAQQAMPAGGDLMIRSQRQNQYAAVTISDTGGGIKPEVVDRIFDAYYSSKPGGSGLGLSIAKKIIDMLIETQRIMIEIDKLLYVNDSESEDKD